MKNNLFLKCTNCNQESIKKEYDNSDSEIDKIMKIGSVALKFPQYVICPYCHGLLTVRLVKENIKK